MLSPNEKRKIVEKCITRELTLYYSQYKTGMAMQVLSAKYAKSTSELGGFPDFMEALRLAGLISVQYSDNGARTVLPGTGEVVPAPAIKKVWF